MTTTVPPEPELSGALVALRSSYPTLGIPKIHSLLLEQNPTWSVSEKRARKVLQSLGLVISSHPSSNGAQGKRKYPLSRLNSQLHIASWTKRVEVKYFDDVKGKGLVATEAISQGDVIWKEDPFALAAEWDLYDLQNRSVACFYCSTPILPSSDTALPCQTTSTSYLRAPTAKKSCEARFCNRLCLSRSNTLGGHLLLCPSANPPSAQLLLFARKHEWMALHALARLTARLLARRRATKSSANKDRIKAEQDFKADWEAFLGLAVLGMEDRFKYATEDDFGVSPAEPDRNTWKEAFEFYMQTFENEKDKGDSPFYDELFTYDGFLRGLGRMSLNLETHGGIYALHSHINHSCTPNASVRHLDPKTALARITVLASKDISQGEELVISYVNPSLNVRERRKRLGEWGFGKCLCERCIREQKDWEAAVGDKINDGGEKVNEMEDLEKELKAGLGVL